MLPVCRRAPGPTERRWFKPPIGRPYPAADLSPKMLDWRDTVLFGQLRDLKKVNSQLKIMVSIGGS